MNFIKIRKILFLRELIGSFATDCRFSKFQKNYEMKQKSKFSFLSIFVCLFLTGSAVGLLYITTSSKNSDIILPTLFLIFVVYFWLTEFRKRAHKIKVFEKKITRTEYFGLGFTEEFYFKKFDGYILTKQPNKGKTSEYIFLIKNDKRIICLSEFYHSNYKKIKLEIESKLKFLGEKKYSFGSEYREMFR